mmetsp:Transcript_7861/g.20176  ORF Transcript_7861/g.20176 Transcript_7861/m.20176 type:complete len:243 (+) Transcript_7861:4305-5033(+)
MRHQTPPAPASLVRPARAPARERQSASPARRESTRPWAAIAASAAPPGGAPGWRATVKCAPEIRRGPVRSFHIGLFWRGGELGRARYGRTACRQCRAPRRCTCLVALCWASGPASSTSSPSPRRSRYGPSSLPVCWVTQPRTRSRTAPRPTSGAPCPQAVKLPAGCGCRAGPRRATCAQGRYGTLRRRRRRGGQETGPCCRRSGFRWRWSGTAWSPAWARSCGSSGAGSVRTRRAATFSCST